MQGYVNLKGYGEFDAANRPDGLNVWLTFVLSPAPPIYGGTDQIQRNIIGERVLGLPREPSSDRETPFSQLPKNA